MKTFAKTAVLLWLVGMVVLVVGGPLLTSNSDVAAEAIVDASGIKENVSMAREERCLQHRENYDKLWERSIEMGNPATMEDALRRAEIAVETFC